MNMILNLDTVRLIRRKVNNLRLFSKENTSNKSRALGRVAVESQLSFNWTILNQDMTFHLLEGKGILF